MLAKTLRPAGLGNLGEAMGHEKVALAMGMYEQVRQSMCKSTYSTNKSTCKHTKVSIQVRIKYKSTYSTKKYDSHRPGGLLGVSPRDVASYIIYQIS